MLGKLHHRALSSPTRVEFKQHGGSGKQPDIFRGGQTEGEAAVTPKSPLTSSILLTSELSRFSVCESELEEFSELEGIALAETNDGNLPFYREMCRVF